MSLTRAEARIVVAKFIELAYSKDKGTTLKILAKAGSSTLSVDQNGRAMLSGAAGFVTFSGDPVLKEIGVRIKRVSIRFNNQPGMGVGYAATFNLAFSSLLIAGSFNLEELIISCSGLLCRAARAMKVRHSLYEKELKNIMGD